MKLIKNLVKSILASSMLLAFACAPQPTAVDFSVNQNEIQIGLEESGKFTKKEDKTFVASDKIILKFKARGLTIKQSKIKTNVDMFLKKDKDVLGTQNDILGADGITQVIPNVDPNYTGTSGEADLQLTVLPPSDTVGEMTANVTIRDLNSMGKVLTFETKFTIKAKS